MKRSKMSRGASRQQFKKTSGAHPINGASKVNRGGIRL